MSASSVDNNKLFKKIESDLERVSKDKKIWLYGVDTKTRSVVIVKKSASFWSKLTFIWNWFFGSISRSQAVFNDLKKRSITNISAEVKISQPRENPVKSDSRQAEEKTSSEAPPSLVNSSSSAAIQVASQAHAAATPLTQQSPSPVSSSSSPVSPSISTLPSHPTNPQLTASAKFLSISRNALCMLMSDEAFRNAAQKMGIQNESDLIALFEKAKSAADKGSIEIIVKLWVDGLFCRGGIFQFGSSSAVRLYEQIGDVPSSDDDERFILKMEASFPPTQEGSLHAIEVANILTGLQLAKIVVDTNEISMTHSLVEEYQSACLSLLQKKQDNGQTALHQAAQFKDLATINALLKACPEAVLVKDNREKTAFHLSVEKRRDCAVFSTLLRADPASIHQRDAKGDTPLHAALIHQPDAPRPEAAVDFLLKNGADLYAKNGRDESPIEIAFQSASASTSLYIIAHFLRLPDSEKPVEMTAKLNQLLNRGWNPLFAAIETGIEDLVDQCLAYGTHLNSLDAEGWTPLHRAILKNSTSIVELLAARGADIEKKAGEQQDGITPLQLAAREGFCNLVAHLSSKNPQIDAVDKKGNSALLLAAQRGHLEVVRFLVDRGANPGLLNGEKFSSVHYLQVAASKCLDNVKIQQFKETIPLLRIPTSINISIDLSNKPLHQAVLSGDIIRLQELLQLAHIDVNEVDDQGNTPLMLAAELGLIEMVRGLIASGAEVNKKNQAGWGALMLAGQKAHLDVMQLLLNHDAQVVFAKRGDVAHATHQDWMYSCDPSVVQLLRSHASSKPLPVLFTQNPTIRQSPNHGNCFLLAALDSLLSSPENRSAVTSIFRETEEGIQVRIRHPRNLLEPPVTEERRKELNDKYRYSYDERTKESVFVLDKLRLHVIDISELGVESNSLGIKILERLANYLYAPIQVDFQGSAVPHFLRNLDRSIFGVVGFLEQLLDLKIETGVLSTEQKENCFSFFRVALIKRESPSTSIFIAMDEGTGGHVWSLGNITGNVPDVVRTLMCQPMFLLKNPWDTSKSEPFTFAQIEQRNGIVGIIRTKKVESELLFAVERGLVDDVRTQLARGGSLDVRASDGRTLMEIAKDNQEISELLSQHLESLHQELREAVRSSNLAEVTRCIKAGANLKEENEILKIALENRSSEVVQLLINSVDSCGQTLLMRAIQSGDLEQIRQLIRLGANLDVADQLGCHPLHYAVIFNRPDVVELLLLFAPHLIDRPFAGDKSWNALHIAVEKDYKEIVDLLIRKGAQLNQKTWGGTERTPLMIAVQNQNEGLVQRLIAAGTDLSQKNIGGKTAYALAQTDKIRALFPQGGAASSSAPLQAKKGCSIEITTPKPAATESNCPIEFNLINHAGALLKAIQAGHLDEINQLKATLNLTGDHELLHWCIRQNFLDILVQLVHFLKIDLKTNKELLLDAAQNGSPAAIAALIEAGASVKEDPVPMQTAFEKDRKDNVRELIMRGACLDHNQMSKIPQPHQTEFYYLFLIRAIEENHVEQVQDLILIPHLRTYFYKQHSQLQALKNRVSPEVFDILDLGNLLEKACRGRYRSDKSPLILAVEDGNLELLQKIIKTLHPSTAELSSALSAVMPLGMARFHIVKELLEKGAALPLLLQSSASPSSSSSTPRLENNLLELIFERAIEEEKTGLVNKFLGEELV
jgi:ankyrin repeat protein